MSRYQLLVWPENPAAIKKHFSGIHGQQSIYTFEQGGFTTSAFAQNGNDLAALNIKTDIVYTWGGSALILFS